MEFNLTNSQVDSVPLKLKLVLRVVGSDAGYVIVHEQALIKPSLLNLFP